MLNYRGLVDLATALRDEVVLTVYVNGEMDDPARRRRWRIELRHALDDVASWLKDAPHSEREDFAARRAQVEARLADFGASVRSPGWVGFYTSSGEFQAGPLPVAVPTMAVWSTGPCLAPYVRAMKEAHPVVVVVADHASIRLYQYVGRDAEPVETIKARPLGEAPPHVSRPPRQGFHQGTRGPTGADAAQREAQASTDRMLHDFVGRLGRLVAPDAWVLVGGIPTMVAAVLSRLPANVAARAARARALDVHATRAQVAAAAREGAQTLREADDLRRVTECLASAQSDGRGAVGALETMQVLQAGNVRELLFTEAFLREHAAEAETAVRMALEHHAFLEEVTGEAAARLDDAGGVAARLRYPAPVPVS